MNDYRKLTDFTDDEIKTILTDIFNPVKIENIVRHENDETITVDITTGGWDDGETHGFEITDEIELTSSGIENVPFSMEYDDILLYRQYLLSKGCDYRLKDIKSVPKSAKNLKPCPFCGKPGKLTEIYGASVDSTSKPLSYRVGCNNDRCAVRPGIIDRSKTAAVTKWNTRCNE